MTYRYTHDNDAAIAALYLSGKNGKEVGRQFGVTDVTVFRALKRQGIPRRPSHAHPIWEDTEGNRRDLVEAYKAGESILAIAKRLRTNTRRVMRVLDESGLSWRHPGGKKRFSDEDSAEFARAYRAGETLTQIAKQHRASTQVIRRYLLRAGVELRPVGAPAFWTDERKAEAVRRHQAGEQIKDSAKAMGCGTTTLTNTLIELGVHERPSRPLGEAHPSWQGGRTVTEGGYIQIKVTDQNRELAGPARRDGHVLEHRLVMAQKLGRPLRPGERPHHRNLIRDDNTPDNLELWLTVQQPPPGGRVADLLKWSLDLLDQYMPEVLVPGWQDIPLPEAIS
jgi:transposase-like protein